VMLELQGICYSVLITAAKKEGEGCKGFGFLIRTFSKRRMYLVVNFKER